MTLVKYQPFNDVDVFDRGLSRFFDSLFDAKDKTTEKMIFPKADIVEDKDKYTVHLDAPGLKKDDVKLAVNNKSLTISGERKDEKKVEDKQSVYREINYGRFERTFTLPEGIESDKIEAKLDNGVLEIVIPKSEKQKPKEIEIKVK